MEKSNGFYYRKILNFVTSNKQMLENKHEWWLWGNNPKMQTSDQKRREHQGKEAAGGLLWRGHIWTKPWKMKCSCSRKSGVRALWVETSKSKGQNTARTLRVWGAQRKIPEPGKRSWQGGGEQMKLERDRSQISQAPLGRGGCDSNLKGMPVKLGSDMIQFSLWEITLFLCGQRMG